jgi:hypothetical protein
MMLLDFWMKGLKLRGLSLLAETNKEWLLSYTL